MQLEACLRSIRHFAPYTGSPIVIYKATSPRFDEGYELLVNSGQATFIEQSSFETDVRSAISREHEYTVFHTDDDLFFRAPTAAPIPVEGVAAFSLRLGRNTTHCYSGATVQALPPFLRSGPYLGWDWTRAQHDFAYPLSLDGHVFATRLLQQLLSGARFQNPNELEEELHLRRYRAPRWLLSLQQSSLVSIPLNIVSSTHANRASMNPQLSAAVLNDRFLAGERVSLDSIDASSICGAHQELALEFEPRGAEA
jgi:hypothetical protein